jgi:hypothetical protein
VVEAVLREDLASRPLVVAAVLVVNERPPDVPKPSGFRVYADPVGHPFCLVTPEGLT